MKLRVTPFGRGGLHIVTARKLGFKENQIVEITLSSENQLTEKRVKELIDEKIAEARGGY